jgi:hypothetical protein
MLRLGRRTDRDAVRRAFSGPGPVAIVYEDVLAARDIREALRGVREAGSPAPALPLLAWLATHTNTPEDVLRDLAREGPAQVLLSLCYNRNLPTDVRGLLLDHPDPRVRAHAQHLHGSSPWEGVQ